MSLSLQCEVMLTQFLVYIWCCFFFKFQFYNVAILESEVLNHIETPMVDQYSIYHQYGQIYFNFDHTTGTSIMSNAGLLSFAAQVHGNALFTEVSFSLSFLAAITIN